MLCFNIVRVREMVRAMEEPVPRRGRGGLGSEEF